MHDKTLPIFVAINLFEPKWVPVVLRGEQDEINKYFMMKCPFVGFASDLIFLVTFSIQEKK